jgi:hypothetical protein
MAALRTVLAVAFATISGLLLAVLDSQPGFDDTAITAIGLAVAAFVAVLIDGSGHPLRVATMAALVGIWIPLVEIAPPGTFGPLLALVFAAAGAAVGLVTLRTLRPARTAAEGSNEGAEPPGTDSLG